MGKMLGLMAILFLCILAISFKEKTEDKNNDIVRTQGNNTISICCSENNDLYKLLKTREQSCNRYDDIVAALEASPENETLLILAKDYPKKKQCCPKVFTRKQRKRT